MLEERDGSADRSSSKGLTADNSRCHVCHMNYEDEELAVSHVKSKIGCERCHGASDAHCGDEDNVTPPDVMYAKAKINPSCITCHPWAKIDTQAHKPVVEALAKGKTPCTDCHGKHRLSHRTRRWDKTTGKPIGDDKVRTIGEQPRSGNRRPKLQEK